MKVLRNDKIRLEINRQELVLLRFVLQQGSIKSLWKRHQDVLGDNANFPGGFNEIDELAFNMHDELCEKGVY